MDYLKVAIFAYIAIFLFRLNWDRNTRLNDKNFVHWKRHIPTLLLLLYPGWKFTQALGGVTILNCIVSAFMMAFVWWFMYDGCAAKFTCRPAQNWWFTGTVDGKKYDARTDVFLKLVGTKWAKIIKIGGITIGVITYTILFIHNFKS